jgi:hypothetical protein
MMEIGPVAVHPEFQGQGYGSKLMDTVENRSNAEKCTVGVVSCREDVIPFFIKRGYKVGTIYFLIISACFLIELAGFFFLVENSKMQFLLKIASIHFMLRMEFASSETCTILISCSQWSTNLFKKWGSCTPTTLVKK